MTEVNSESTNNNNESIKIESDQNIERDKEENVQLTEAQLKKEIKETKRKLLELIIRKNQLMVQKIKEKQAQEQKNFNNQQTDPFQNQAQATFNPLLYPTPFSKHKKHDKKHKHKHHKKHTHELPPFLMMLQQQQLQQQQQQQQHQQQPQQFGSFSKYLIDPQFSQTNRGRPPQNQPMAQNSLLNPKIPLNSNQPNQSPPFYYQYYQYQMYSSQQQPSTQPQSYLFPSKNQQSDPSLNPAPKKFKKHQKGKSKPNSQATDTPQIPPWIQWQQQQYQQQQLVQSFDDIPISEKSDQNEPTLGQATEENGGKKIRKVKDPWDKYVRPYITESQEDGKKEEKVPKGSKEEEEDEEEECNDEYMQFNEQYQRAYYYGYGWYK